MELQTVDQSEFTSIFGGNTTSNTQKSSGFAGVGDENSMFKPEEKKEEKKEEKEISLEEQQKLLEEAENKDGKSLFDEKVIPKDFGNVRSLFEDLIKNNQLFPLADEKLDTPEDVKALIMANVAHQLEEDRKNDNNAWYASKSPAWRIVAEFSEKAQHPSELLPFIQSVQIIDRVAELDPKNEIDAERIIRLALVNRNESEDIIEETLSTYKDNGKLTALAEKYQPTLIQNEQIKMEQMQAQKQKEEYDNYNMIRQIHDDSVRVLETPFLGKHKLTKEEKAGIYNMIASPDEQSGGYKIFAAIDNLYETKDFEKLRKIALILQNEAAYNQYVGIDVASYVAEGALRKLKLTSTGSSSANVDEPAQVKQQPMNQLNTNKDSGFGYYAK